MKNKSIWLITTSMLVDEPLSGSDLALWNSLQKMPFITKLLNPLDISIFVTDDNITLYENNIEIPPPDLVIVRKKRGAEEHVYTLAQALLKLNVRFFEPVSSGGVGKSATTIKRAGKIKIIPTLLAKKENIIPAILEKTFTYPLIVKPQKGFRGNGVFLVSNENELNHSLRHIDGEIMVQPFIEIRNEYRVMVINGVAIGVAKKVSDEVVKNAAVGGHFEAADRKDIALFGERAAALQAGRVFGVDIAESVDGDLYVIECNRAPEFLEFNTALGIKVEELILQAVSTLL